jgi:hypothetical protein
MTWARATWHLGVAAALKAHEVALAVTVIIAVALAFLQRPICVLVFSMRTVEPIGRRLEAIAPILLTCARTTWHLGVAAALEAHEVALAVTVIVAVALAFLQRLVRVAVLAAFDANLTDCVPSHPRGLHRCAAGELPGLP